MNTAMITRNECNGWTTYETWRINLEVIDGMTLEDFGFDLHDVDTDDVADVERLAHAIESHVVDSVMVGGNELALNLLEHFFTQVDWVELAEHIISAAREG